MKKMYKNTTVPSADELADMTDRGEDISCFFSNNGKMRYPSQKIGVDFAADMLRELDDVAAEMNVGRLAIIKIFLRHALDRYYSARKERVRTD